MHVLVLKHTELLFYMTLRGLRFLPSILEKGMNCELWRTKIPSIDRKWINSLAFSILQSHYGPTEGLRSVPSYSSWTALYRCWPFPDTRVELNTLKQPWLTCSKMNTSTWKTWVYVRIYCPFFSIILWVNEVVRFLKWHRRLISHWSGWFLVNSLYFSLFLTQSFRRCI